MTSAPAPDIQVLSDERRDGGRTVKVTLHSPRGATEIDLLLPMKVLMSLTVGDQTYTPQPEQVQNNLYVFACYGRTCDGLELTLRIATTDPVNVFLVDYTYGLPPGGDRFVQARQPNAVPAYDGDLTTIARRVKL